MKDKRLINILLKKIKHKDLSMCGVRAESELNDYKKTGKIHKKNLKAIQKILNQ